MSSSPSSETMPTKPCTSKYGVSLTEQATWKGWPLRVGHFQAEGRVENLVAGCDTVLVWSGGSSEVTLHAARVDAASPGRCSDLVCHRFTRRSGNVDLLPQGTVLQDVVWRGEAMGCVSVQLETQTMQARLGRPTALDPELGVRLGLSDVHMVDLVRHLEAQAFGEHRYGDAYVEALSLTLATYVYGRYGAGGSPQGRPSEAEGAGLTPLQAEQIVSFVDDHLADNLSAGTLASLVGYSADHFARLFKSSFGLSPYQYVLGRRVERAKLLLRDRGHSIAQVAIASGFGTQAHLNTVFKARTGMTPGAYRKA